MTKLNSSCSETVNAIAMCNRRVGILHVACVINDLSSRCQLHSRTVTIFHFSLALPAVSRNEDKKAADRCFAA